MKFGLLLILKRETLCVLEFWCLDYFIPGISIIVYMGIWNKTCPYEITKYCRNWSLWDDFWRLRFYMGQFGPECYFLTFRAQQDGSFRFFFEKFHKDMSYFKSPYYTGEAFKACVYSLDPLFISSVKKNQMFVNENSRNFMNSRSFLILRVRSRGTMFQWYRISQCIHLALHQSSLQKDINLLIPFYKDLLYEIVNNNTKEFCMKVSLILSIFSVCLIFGIFTVFRQYREKEEHNRDAQRGIRLIWW